MILPCLACNISERNERSMKELIVPAEIEQLDTVLNFISDKLTEMNCSVKIQSQIAVAVEEIFVNIAHYAYTPNKGNATVRYGIENDPLKILIQFGDNGIPYNPLEKAAPDTTLSADERDIGGLGIFIVKKSMDDVHYEYKNGQNVLTIQKLL
jgi:serine/threonine-protein kinase RsbW